MLAVWLAAKINPENITQDLRCIKCSTNTLTVITLYDKMHLVLYLSERNETAEEMKKILVQILPTTYKFLWIMMLCSTEY